MEGRTAVQTVRYDDNATVRNRGAQRRPSRDSGCRHDPRKSREYQGVEGAATQLDTKSHARNNSAGVSEPPQQLKGGTVGECEHAETESENSGVTHRAHSAIRS